MSRASFSIAPDDPCLDGHFPGQPLVPAVVILEAVIALAGARAAQAGVQITRCKFAQPLWPGQVCHVELDQTGDNGMRFSCTNDAGQTLVQGRLRTGGVGDGG